MAAGVYSVEVDRRQGVDVYCLREGKRARAELVPAFGSNLVSFVAGAPVLEEVPFEALAAKPTSYGIPVLFPFPNRVRDGAFAFGGRTFRVDPPRHGFVRDKPWEVVGSGASADDGAWVTTGISAAEHPDTILSQFPFPFRLELTWGLRDATLELRATARNLGEETMPAGFGIHPYFRRPETGTVRVPARRRWVLTDSLPTGERVEVEGKYDLRRPVELASLELDDVLTDLETDRDGRVRCVLADESLRRRTIIEFDPAELPEVVVY
ncbi:MAG: aldose 1-epimerase, partial [Candidatus Binatia bacterium]